MKATSMQTDKDAPCEGRHLIFYGIDDDRGEAEE
jgi:hypothetical protein